MRIDEYIRFTREYKQPHVHIYATPDELDKLSRKYYINLVQCHEDFKDNPDIWNKLVYFFMCGIHYTIVKEERIIHASF